MVARAHRSDEEISITYYRVPMTWKMTTINPTTTVALHEGLLVDGAAGLLRGKEELN